MYILNILVVTTATCGKNQPNSFLLVCLFNYRYCALSFLSLHLPRPCVCAQLKYCSLWSGDAQILIAYNIRAASHYTILSSQRPAMAPQDVIADRTSCSVRPSAILSVTILNNQRVSQSFATILYDNPS